MKKNKVTNILLGLVGLIICGFVFKAAYNTMHEGLITYKSPLVDQHELFTDSTKKLLRFIGASKERMGQPSSDYIYNDQYTITIFKCVLKGNDAFRGQLQLSEGNVVNLNGFYTTGGNDKLKIKYKNSRIDTASLLSINYDGEIVDHKFENDLFYSFLRFKEYSLSYDKERLILRAEARKNSSPAAIAVLKKANFMYIINMTIYNKENEMPPNLLYDLLKK